MQKKFLLLLALTLGFSLSAVYGQQIFSDKIGITEGNSSNKTNAVIYLPANYSKSKKYPLVIFSHGIGEAGTDINKLYRTGLPKVLKDGYRPAFDFIMIAPQRNSFSVDPAWIPGIIQDATKRWGIDLNRVYLTGLSAGGWMTYGSQMNFTVAFAKKIAGIVINSGVTGNANKSHYDWWKQTKTPVWAVVGGNDPNYVKQNTAMVNEINKRVPGLATLTVRPGLSHTGWNDVYSGKVKINGKDMWQWLYQFSRANSNFPGGGTGGDNNGDDNNNNGGSNGGGNSGSSPTRYIKVNVYSIRNSNAGSEWNNWYIKGALVSNAKFTNFKFSNGSASSISAVLSRSYQTNDNYAGYGSGMAPAEVLRYDSYDVAPRTLTISGLNTSKTYNLEFYASRKIRTGEQTIFKIGSASQTVSTDNNLTHKASFSNIRPNAQGQIVITISNSKRYNFLNGFTITENGQ